MFGNKDEMAVTYQLRGSFHDRITRFCKQSSMGAHLEKN